MGSVTAVAVLLGLLQVTSYRSVPEQTDTSPYYTSIGVHVHPHGVAVSQDLLRSHQVAYGDVLYIDGYGYFIVNDCMAARMTNAVDIWVETYEQEKKIGLRYRQVYVLRKPTKLVKE
jgi:3D (Asp-Asp-Asp) domain-containing protein